MQSATRNQPAPRMSVDEAWDEVTRLPRFDPNLKIQAIKELRQRTGLGLKEAKDAVDERLGDVSLEAILADLHRRDGRGAASAPEVVEQTRVVINDPHEAWQVPEPNGHLATAADLLARDDRRRQAQREASRRYRAKIPAEHDASRPPVRPSHEDLAWSLVGALVGAIGTDARQVLAAAGLTIEIVAKGATPRA